MTDARALLLAVGLLAGCGEAVAESGLPLRTLSVGGVRVSAEVADTPEVRRKGLMFRESLPEDGGMLCVFPAERVRGFWMKDTPLPLTIAYADAEGRIVRIADYHVDVVPAGTLIVLRNDDVPGVIGRVGTILGDHRINIAEYHQARMTRGGDALAAISVDGDVGAPVRAALLGLPDGDIPGKSEGAMTVLDFGPLPGNTQELGVMLIGNGDRGSGARGGSTQATEALLFEAN